MTNVTLRRRAQFSSGHSYFLAALTENENRALFGGYSSGEGHGHNYSIEAAVSGPIDARTGMVVNITEIDRLMKERIVSALDGRFLNREVPFFKSHAPSTENIVFFALEELKSRIPEPACLTGVTVWEMPTLWASWISDDLKLPNTNAMIYLTRSYDFSASHRLHSENLTDDENRALFGKCNNPNGHGHNYDIEITLAGTADARSGMLFPLDELDKIVSDEVLLPLDHKHLNYDVEEFAHVNPTSEMLAVVIWRRLARRLPVKGDPRLFKVVVQETARNFFEYLGD